ncbi:MAG: hypothetical protein RR319_06790, partial [Bacteroides sp.]
FIYYHQMFWKIFFKVSSLENEEDFLEPGCKDNTLFIYIPTILADLFLLNKIRQQRLQYIKMQNLVSLTKRVQK